MRTGAPARRWTASSPPNPAPTTTHGERSSFHSPEVSNRAGMIGAQDGAGGAEDEERGQRRAADAEIGSCTSASAERGALGGSAGELGYTGRMIEPVPHRRASRGCVPCACRRVLAGFRRQASHVYAGLRGGGEYCPRQARAGLAHRGACPVRRRLVLGPAATSVTELPLSLPRQARDEERGCNHSG